MNKAIFFDRDGVLIKAIVKNRKPLSIKNIEDINFLIDDNELFFKLKSIGYKLIIVTNQPDVARNEISRKFVEKVNSIIIKKYKIDYAYACLHDDISNCSCRKPKNGLLIKAQKDFNLNLEECFLIGDRWKDITAAKSSGCKSIFIDYNYNEKKPKEYTFKVNSTLEAINIILKYDEQKS